MIAKVYQESRWGRYETLESRDRALQSLSAGQTLIDEGERYIVEDRDARSSPKAVAHALEEYVYTFPGCQQWEVD